MLYVSDTLVDSYYAEKYISDIDSFDNFKAYLKQHNYQLIGEIKSTTNNRSL